MRRHASKPTADLTQQKYADNPKNPNREARERRVKLTKKREVDMKCYVVASFCEARLQAEMLHLFTIF